MLPTGVTVNRLEDMRTSDADRQQGSQLVVLGSCKLDLRRAALSPGVTVIETRVFGGSLDVIVPEDVWVDFEALTIMGSKSLHLSGPRPAANAPRLLIRGAVVAGSVAIRDLG